MQINYLNKALNLFSTAIVSPVYYVFFTTTTIVTSAVFFKGFHSNSTIGLVSMLIGFFVIVSGVSLLFQYNLTQRRLMKLAQLEGGIAGSSEVMNGDLMVSSDNILMNSMGRKSGSMNGSRFMSSGTMNRDIIHVLNQDKHKGYERGKKKISVSRMEPDSIVTTRELGESYERGSGIGRSMDSADGFMTNGSELDLK